MNTIEALKSVAALPLGFDISYLPRSIGNAVAVELELRNIADDLRCGLAHNARYRVLALIERITKWTQVQPTPAPDIKAPKPMPFALLRAEARLADYSISRPLPFYMPPADARRLLAFSRERNAAKRRG